ncbi:MAG: FtsX-like permease family protein [Chloroflexi bacterium]|nr:FtsX-like permease family protein [Chloroflexota bacterium]
MRSPRFKKIVRDLWQNKGRTLLVILAIAIGIFGVGTILTASVILTREINRNYLDTNPASVIFYGDDFDEALIAEISSWPEVDVVEPRSRVTGRYQVAPNQWMMIQLFVIDDFDNLRVNTFYPETGGWTPAANEILIERAAMDLLGGELGETAVIKTPNGTPQNLTISGVVHDPGQAPAWMEGYGYGYITSAGVAQLGELPTFNQLRIVASENVNDREAMRQLANKWQAQLNSMGVPITRSEVPAPGEHPHNGQMKTLLFLLQAFGILALVLSGILVATLISALIGQQIRQIGVMKAYGARRRQIISIYLGMVVVLGVVALFIGLPLGNWGGTGYATFAATMLNFEIASYDVGLWVYLVQIGAALLIPALAAALPVYQGSRITVREAISDYGIDDKAFGTRAIDTLLGRVQGRSRALVMALRNPFRRQGRLLMTVLALAAGGAVFMMALSVGASWKNTTDLEFSSRDYGAMVQLKRPFPTADITSIVETVPDVTGVEGWLQVQTAVNYPDNTQGQAFQLLGQPADSQMVNFPLLEGRWLRPDETNAVVVTHLLAAEEPSIAVGEPLSFHLNGEEVSWEVVGIVRVIGAGTVFANANDVAAHIGVQEQTNYLLVGTNTTDVAGETAVLQQVEAAMAEAGIPIVTAAATTSMRQSLDDHLVIIVALLVIMSVLVAAVGGLGLMSTMSLNVLERRREIGVMRAVGATMARVLFIILGEGLVIGLLSWGLAVLLSFPMTNLVATISGQIFIETPLAVVYSWQGMGIWLGVVVVLTAVASSLPALQATDLPVNQVLAYE